MPARRLFLELLKQTLTHSLWDDPGVDVESPLYEAAGLKRRLVVGLSRLLRRWKLRIVKDLEYTDEQRRQGMIWPSMAYTMIGLPRLDNLQRCLETVLADDIPGDVIETGVWKGGACIFARAVLAASGDETRRVFVADSFAGLPAPDTERYPADAGENLCDFPALAISRAEVEDNFRRFGLLDERVIFLEGWFRDTLPTAPIEALSVLRLDGDLYESTIDALNHLYPKLSPGGFCIIDDYHMACCRQAVSDYRAEHGIDEPIEPIDWAGVYWRRRPR